MLQYFDDLGRRIERAWRARDFDERAFAAIAAAALRDAPPARHARYADVVDALLFGAAPPQPHDQTFGQPRVVAYTDPRFFIEVLCWMDATTAIHQHAFSGAFAVMAGSSVHTQYDFRPRARINQHFALGDVRFRRCELLNAGDVRAIEAGAGFIHALFHLDRPSISVVVRTHLEADAGPQFEYLPPHVALHSFERLPVTAQRTAILRALLASDRAAFDRVVARTLAESDLATVFRALQFVQRRTVTAPYELDASEFDAHASAARARFGARVDALVASIAGSTRIDDLAARRADVADPELRFFLALLMNLPNRREVYRLVAARYGGDPAARVARWLRELTRARPDGGVSLLDLELAGSVEGGADAAASLGALVTAAVDAMLAGARGDALYERLGATLPAGLLDDVRDDVAALEATLLRGALAPLFVDAEAVADEAAPNPFQADAWTPRHDA